MRRIERALVLALLAGAFAAGGAGAADVGAKLQTLQSNVEAERARAAELRRQSEAILQELDQLRAQTIAAARAEQEAESALTGLESKLGELGVSEERDIGALNEGHSELALRLAALQRIALFPPEALLSLRESPLDTVRSALLLRSAMPAIEAHAAQLRAELDRLASLRDAIVKQRAAVVTAKGKLADRRAQLASLIDRQHELYQANESERQSAETHVASLSSQAKDLRDLMDRIEAADRARAETLSHMRPPAPPSAATASPATAATPPGQAPDQAPDQLPGQANPASPAAAPAELPAATTADSGTGDSGTADSGTGNPGTAGSAPGDSGSVASTPGDTVSGSAASSGSPTPPADALLASPPAASSAAAADPERLAALVPGPTSPGPTMRAFSGARGLLAMPARGEVVKGFGESGQYGALAKGITIRTRPAAEVVALYDGKVVFAGEFPGKGQIVIIEHSEGYHSLLSGLTRIDAVAGQMVLAGEPVGVMGQSEDGNGPELYVELRRNGRPIDPLPWLASQTGKVSG